jgi:SAM-dependent methyltransferase
MGSSEILNNTTQVLNTCIGCGSPNLAVLEAGHEHKIFLTDADEMSVITGVSGCEACGLTFLNPRMGQETLFKYYSKQSRIPRKFIPEDSPFANLMESQIEFINSFISIASCKNVLEIGCAEGFFLKSLAAHSLGEIEIYGVELSEKYIAQAHALLPNAHIFETPLEQTDFGNIKFDLIVLRHVFEHLGDPTEALKIIRSILSEDGVLYIEIPDSEDIEPSVSRFYHHEHLLYLTPAVLDRYLSTNGLQTIVGKRFTGNPVGSGFSYPVIRSLSKKGLVKLSQPIPAYARTVFLNNKKRNENYIAELLKPILKRLYLLQGKGKKIALFGAGPHTMDLLEVLQGEKIQWAKIFDNNENKQGKMMKGISIVKPDVKGLGSVDCILISSCEFEQEILAQIKSLGCQKIEVMPLYGSNA